MKRMYYRWRLGVWQRRAVRYRSVWGEAEARWMADNPWDHKVGAAMNPAFWAGETTRALSKVAVLERQSGRARP